MGNSGVLLRAYVYMRMLGRDGMERVAEYATLNANYLMAGCAMPVSSWRSRRRRASHEFIVTLKHEAKDLHLTAMDVAKALLDKNYHAPTTYFPAAGARVPAHRADRNREQGDAGQLRGRNDRHCHGRAKEDGVQYKDAPYTMPVRRLDDVKAARELDLRYDPE